MDNTKKVYTVTKEQYEMLRKLEEERVSALRRIVTASLYKGHITIRVSVPGKAPWRMGIGKIRTIIANAEFFKRVIERAEKAVITSDDTAILTDDDINLAEQIK